MHDLLTIPGRGGVGPLAGGSAALGTAVAVLTSMILWLLYGERTVPAGLSRFERERRARLRTGSTSYRRLEPLIEWLAERGGAKSSPMLEGITRGLAAAAEPLPWTAAEYLAAKRIEAVFAGLFGFVFGWLLFEDPLAGIPVGLLAAWGYQTLMVQAVSDRARRRLRAFKRRLPYAVDLMALMMEAGSGFQESLEAVVRENRGNPLGEEFGDVLREIALGRTRREALESLRSKLNDEDVSELVFAVVKGEELGTPLVQILRSQAKQMLVKHSLWIERESAEAQVLIVFPGMIIMVACLLVIIAPFILSAIYGSR